MFQGLLAFLLSILSACCRPIVMIQGIPQVQTDAGAACRPVGGFFPPEQLWIGIAFAVFAIVMITVIVVRGRRK